MNDKSNFIAHLRGHDVYYVNGCFTLDPLPDLVTLQTIVSYLIDEGFVNVDESL
jgi:hypothetical protein